MSFLSKHYLLLKVIYLLIRCYKTRFFLWNKNNADKDGVHKDTHTYIHTHTHTHTCKDTPNTHKKITLERVSMKISDTPPPFFKQRHLFYQPLHFYGKNLNPSLFFLKISTTQPPFQVPILFLKKINFSWWFSQSKHSGQEKIRSFSTKFSYICVK